MQSNQCDYATFLSRAGRVGPYQCGRDMRKKRGWNEVLGDVPTNGEVPLEKPRAPSFSDVGSIEP